MSASSEATTSSPTPAGIGAGSSASVAGTSVGGGAKGSLQAVVTTAAVEKPVLNINKELFEQKEKLYENIIANHPLHVGKSLSSRERDSKGLAASTLVYGEIKFEPYAIAFMKVKQLYGGLSHRGGRFVDVGSGTGKPVFAAAVLHDWDACVGVEILEGLYGASVEMLQRWSTSEIQDILPPAQKNIKIDFIHGDATTVDWATGTDVFFMNSTCYDDKLMEKFAEVADRMPLGAFGITFTKRLPSAKWAVLESEVYQMSWGAATVFIQQKLVG